MAHAANKARHDSAQDLSDAFNVHAALVAAEAKRPELKNNPRWKLLRMDAYEVFWAAWEGGAQ